MEENNSKIVDINTAKSEQKPEKMSYEQLENIAHQLSEQAKQLYTRLQEANMTNMFKRLDYLFKIIENKDSFSDAFLTKCITEVEELMTIPEKSEEDLEAESKTTKEQD